MDAVVIFIFRPRGEKMKIGRGGARTPDPLIKSPLWERMYGSQSIKISTSSGITSLAWDINAQKTQLAGYLPDGMCWYNRTIFLDTETGMAYLPMSISWMKNVI